MPDRKILTIAPLCCAVAAALSFSCASAPTAGPTISPGPVVRETLEDPGEMTFDVPRLDSISIDGAAEDWQSRGLSVKHMYCNVDRSARDDFDASFRLGWNADGLLLVLTVMDDVACESGDAKSLWRRDSAEIYVADGHGSKSSLQLLVAPGLDKTIQGGMRQAVHDRRQDKKTLDKLEVRVATGSINGGYVIEAMIPWKNFRAEAAPGTTAAFQIYVNDMDGENDTRTQLRWFRLAGARVNTKRMHRIRLSESPGPEILAAAYGSYPHMVKTRVTVTALAELAGASLEARSRGKVIARGTLTKSGGHTAADLDSPMPPIGEPHGPIDVWLAGRRISRIVLPDADVKRTQAFMNGALDFDAVFSGTALPAIDFEIPGWMETLTGPYTIQIDYYNSRGVRVTSADSVGRYGAIVRLRSTPGAERVEHLTLFRHTKRRPRRAHEEWTLAASDVRIPEYLGIAAKIAEARQRTLVEFARHTMANTVDQGQDMAILLAGLSETEPDMPEVERCSPWHLNRKWWYRIKRERGEAETRFQLSLPQGYEEDASRKWPLVVFLHGAGERGDKLSMIEKHAIPKLIKQGRKFPFIAVSPQCEKNDWWLSYQVGDLVSEMEKKHRVDGNRIYLTGLSMGGFGTWSTALEYPDRFAAIAPICGGGDPADAARIKHVPTWVFHGARDRVVPVDMSRNMVDALREAGGKPGFTIYAKAGHDSWTATYENDALYDWLLANRLGSEPVAPPDSDPVN